MLSFKFGRMKAFAAFTRGECHTLSSVLLLTEDRLGPNIVRVLPSTCVTFLVYENSKFYLPRLYDPKVAEDAKYK